MLRLLLVFFIASVVSASLQAQGYLVARDSAKIAAYLQESAQRKAAKDWRGASDLLNKSALVYWDAREFQKAIDLFHQSLALNRLVDNQSGIFGINNNLAFLHADLQQYDSSVYYFNKVLEGRRRQQVSEPIISALINLSVVTNKLKRYEESVKVLQEALELARSQNNLERMRTCYGLLAETYEKMGDLNKTQEYFERYKSIVDMLNRTQLSALSEELSKEQEARRKIEEARRLAQMEARLREEALSRATHRLTAQDSAIANLNERYTKNQMALEILRQDSVIKILEIDRLNYEKEEQRNRLYLWLAISIAVLLMAVVIIAFLYRIEKNKERENRLLQAKNEELAVLGAQLRQRSADLEAANQELAAALEQVNLQKQIIEKRNKDISESINYAAGIQRAMLSFAPEVIEVLPPHFVFYQPRDVVGGDFYWFNVRRQEHETLCFIVAADCTGHGVPGAFMSMLGSALLNQIINQQQVTNPADILQKMHEGLNDSLHQQQFGNHDGMDIGICVLYGSNGHYQRIEFAGAKMSLIYIQQGDMLQIYKGDRWPIGGYDPKIKHQFNTFSLHLTKKTHFYLASDGFADQFGGLTDRKFSTGNFKALLQQAHTLPIEAQKEFLQKHFSQWKGDFPQIDDVMVVGFACG
ncbi:MAG: tetratricopeptide repeat protein [Cytophagales bacterium]|nr:tetratricopeptide repeat protein [Bernardetiaceae bacterium]MDW8204576.1 tetratricopeptide repeat protein [Cytophagales bacterium]